LLRSLLAFEGSVDTHSEVGQEVSPMCMVTGYFMGMISGQHSDKERLL